MSKPADYLLNVWIIDRQSAVCIFDKQFTDSNIDPDLISGFLVAINSFGQEISNRSIQSINFEDYQIAVEVAEHYYLALAYRDGFPARSLKKLISDIGHKFESRFADHLDTFCGNIDVFESFDTSLEEIVKKRSNEGGLFKAKKFNVIPDFEKSYRGKLESSMLNSLEGVENDYGSFFADEEPQVNKVSGDLEDLFAKLGREHVK